MSHVLSGVTCAECGHHNKLQARFCSSCGTELVSGEATTTHTFMDIGDSGPLADVDLSSFRSDQGLFVVLEGSKAGARYSLDADLVRVGRHPESDIFLDDITVSRRHAEIVRESTVYRVQDVGSLNGTYLNRRRVDDAELVDGDEVRIGKYKLIFAHGTGSL